MARKPKKPVLTAAERRSLDRQTSIPWTDFIGQQFGPTVLESVEPVVRGSGTFSQLVFRGECKTGDLRYVFVTGQDCIPGYFDKNSVARHVTFGFEALRDRSGLGYEG